LYFATDINKNACRATQGTASLNNQHIQCINTKFIDGLRHQMDLLIFNPPYVVTTSAEVGSLGIEAAWAGGIDGREVIDEFLGILDQLLRIGGILYLVLINENKPKEIIASLANRYIGSVVKYRVAGWEGLSIVKFVRVQ
jgi:release factor glutamine methyltransferase